LSKYYHHHRPAFFLLDVLLGISVFAIFIGIAGYALISTQNISIVSGDRIRGASLSQQAIEAVRSLRDDDFDNLSEGTFGLAINSVSGEWELSGAGTVSEDGFTTQVQISLPDEDHALVSAETTWSFGSNRSGTSSITTQLSNWQQVKIIGNWEVLSELSSIAEDPAPRFNDIAITGNYVFVTSEVATGGAGLYVFDTTNLSFPSRIADGFNLGADGYQLIVCGDTLYVLSTSSSAEVRAYSITSPEAFADDKLIGSYNIPGSGRARSLAIFGSTLFVGTITDAVEDEIYALDITDPTDIQLLDSLDDDGSYLDMYLHNGYAYVSSTEDVAELTVVDIFDPADIKFAPGVGYNLTDVPDGLAVIAFGNSVLLGRAYGDVIQELVLFDVEENPVPTPPPGPWYHGIGADLSALDIEPAGEYTFAATAHDSAELQVIDLEKFRLGQLPRVASIDTDTGVGRGIKYDIQRDRLFFTTDSAIHIFAPGI